MILLREIQEKDLETLEKFSQIPGFINLPNDRDLLLEKIMRSQSSFNDDLEDMMDGKYLFVAEDLDRKVVLGTSMIAAKHGSLESPHFYFHVGTEEKYSETINTGFIHGTLELGYETDGPSEIGGLVIDPEYRNDTVARVGRQISFVRFLFLAMNPDRFKKKILAELLPPLNKKGQSPLWEAIGRRFTNMDYWEADQLCQKNKEFIFSLFPTGKIYTTFLSAEARNAIGKVGKDTEPVMHMLKKIGFKYTNQVDPFDAGPHLWANAEDLVPIKKMRLAIYDPGLKGEQPAEAGLVTKKWPKGGEAKGQFRAVTAKTIQANGKIAFAEIDVAKAEAALGIQAGDTLAFMPYY